MRLIRRRRQDRTSPTKYIERKEFDNHLNKENEARAKIDARLRAIEHEYGLELKPVRLKEVNGE